MKVWHMPFAKIETIYPAQASELNELVHLKGVRWNGKKPQGGGETCPKISGTTGADYVLEDRR